MRGRKPLPTALKVVAGNPGKRALNRREPVPTGAVERPAGLEGRVAELWDNIIARAFWLRWPDGPKAFMWCCLQAQFEDDPGEMKAARIAQLRALGSELGFDPSGRSRMALEPTQQSSKFAGLIGATRDPGEEYFQ